MGVGKAAFMNLYSMGIRPRKDIEVVPEKSASVLI